MDPLTALQTASALIELVKACRQSYQAMSSLIKNIKKMGVEVADLEQRFKEQELQMWTFAKTTNLIADGTRQSLKAILGSLAPGWVTIVEGRFALIGKHMKEAEEIVHRYADSPPPKMDELPQGIAKRSTFDLEKRPTESPSVVNAQDISQKHAKAIQKSSFKSKLIWSVKDKEKLDLAIGNLEKDNQALLNLTGPSQWNLMFDAITSKMTLDDLEISMARASSRTNETQIEPEKQRYDRRVEEQHRARRHIATLEGETTNQKLLRRLDISSFPGLYNILMPDLRTRTSAMFRLNGRDEEVLIEWKEWDSDFIEREEVITRVSDVVAILNSPPTFLQNILSSPGFFEDSRSNDRGTKWIGIVYRTSPLGYRPKIRTLRELLTRKNDKGGFDKEIWKPALGDRFRLAQRLAETLLAVHNCEWLHKGLRPENVVFFSGPKSITDPYLLGWDYSRSADPGQSTEPVISWNEDAELYQHPEWFKELSSEKENNVLSRFRIEFDQYQLGCLLLEIGHWWLIGDLKDITTHTFSGPEWRESWRTYLETKARKLEPVMGKIYSDIVLDLLQGLDADGRGLEFWDAVVLNLRRCHA